MNYIYLWLIILVAAIIVEIITTQALVSIWFAVGSLAAMIAELLNLSIGIQIIIFFTVSILSLALIRPIASKYFRGNIIATNADRLIHQRTYLIKEISEYEYGEIKINGVIWNVISDEEKPIPIGTKVEILAIDGSKLVVKSIK